MFTGLIGGFIFLMLFIIVIGILLFVFWIVMLIDCAKRNFKRDSDKVVWILVIIFLNLLGASIYYFVVKINDKRIVKKKK